MSLAELVLQPMLLSNKNQSIDFQGKSIARIYMTESLVLNRLILWKFSGSSPHWKLNGCFECLNRLLLHIIPQWCFSLGFFFNQLHVINVFLFLLKTSENQRLYNIVRGRRERPVAWNELIYWCSTCSYILLLFHLWIIWNILRGTMK